MAKNDENPYATIEYDLFGNFVKFLDMYANALCNAMTLEKW